VCVAKIFAAIAVSVALESTVGGGFVGTGVGVSGALQALTNQASKTNNTSGSERFIFICTLQSKDKNQGLSTFFPCVVLLLNFVWREILRSCEPISAGEVCPSEIAKHPLYF